MSETGRGGDDNRTTRDFLPDDASSQLRLPREKESGGGGGSGGGVFFAKSKKATTFIPSSSQHAQKSRSPLFFFRFLFAPFVVGGCAVLCADGARVRTNHARTQEPSALQSRRARTSRQSVSIRRDGEKEGGWSASGRDAVGRRAVSF